MAATFVFATIATAANWVMIATMQINKWHVLILNHLKSLAKFYFPCWNDRVKGRMGRSRVAASFTESYFEFSVAGERSNILYSFCLQHEKSGKHKTRYINFKG